MHNNGLYQQVNQLIREAPIDIDGEDNLFYTRFMANTTAIFDLYAQLYEHHPGMESNFNQLIQTIIKGHRQRPGKLKERDHDKIGAHPWLLSNQLAGMSLYVDRFCGDLKSLNGKLDYFEKLGVNLLHLMPLFESPADESDGGYAVSDFRKVDQRFGTLDDLRALQQEMQQRNMYLMLDIVLNHTSHQHAWARKAGKGEKEFQDYYYFFKDRSLPDQYDSSMPEIFPEVAPGNFTYIPGCKKWVMSVFHNYQWDLNYTNPHVFVEMLDIIFLYANLGVDVLRIDAPAFIWKQLGTTCQNLSPAHTILRLIRLCVEIVAPGMALLGEAIVAPKEILNYFGTGDYTARECNFAYNVTHMALQWDMLATGDTRVMLAAQQELLKKPFGTSWITYTRCHDDIGLGYDDAMIEQAGYDPYEHRNFLKDYYSGAYKDSPAKGALFSSNPKTGDARISGTLASLCGLEKAIESGDSDGIKTATQKILLMQAHSLFLGGLPMLYYGDELGYTNDYSYLKEKDKSYDNRWMHRPLIDWEKNKKIDRPGTIENRIFTGLQKLIALRKKLDVVADHSNITWMTPHNTHVAGYIRSSGEKRLYGVFNFQDKTSYLTWYAFRENAAGSLQLSDHWSKQIFAVGEDKDHLLIPPYGFLLLEPIH